MAVSACGLGGAFKAYRYLQGGTMGQLYGTFKHPCFTHQVRSGRPPSGERPCPQCHVQARCLAADSRLTDTSY